MTVLETGRHADGRGLGARAGVVLTLPIALVVASVPMLIALSGNRDGVPVVPFGAALALAGIVAAAAVGALFGPRLVRDPVAFRSGSILAMCVVAIVMGAYAFGVGIAVTLALWSWSAFMYLVWAPVAGTIGLLAFGLPALVLVVPHAVVWRWLMRRWLDA